MQLLLLLFSICRSVELTQQNSYSISYLLGPVTTQWLDSDGVVTTVNCQQQRDYTGDYTAIGSSSHRTAGSCQCVTPQSLSA